MARTTHAAPGSLYRQQPAEHEYVRLDEATGGWCVEARRDYLRLNGYAARAEWDRFAGLAANTMVPWQAAPGAPGGYAVFAADLARKDLTAADVPHLTVLAEATNAPPGAEPSRQGSDDGITPCT